MIEILIEAIPYVVLTGLGCLLAWLVGYIQGSEMMLRRLRKPKEATDE